MALFRLLLALSLTLGFIWFMNRPVRAGEQTLPPPGAFFSPQHGFWQQAEPLNRRPQTLLLPSDGLEGPVTICLDKELIPRIFAENERDAAFAQGYISAYLRLFQMDLSTRSPIGRLSEVIGERTLEHDLTQRRKGLLEAAERLAADWMADPSVRPVLQAYLNGINARIAELTPASLPLEYKILHFKPEPWDAVRSAAFYLAMSETLALTARDLPLSNAYQILGAEAFALLYPDWNPYDDPVIPSADTLHIEGAAGRAPVSPPPSGTWGYHQTSPPNPPGVGSNNWAIAPKLTRNGHPLLCNDPHLALTLPSIWLEMQVSTPEQDAYGVAFVAIPGIAIGFNRDIAWGFTNAGHDVQDWYTITWTDREKTRYLLDGREVDATLREELIYVKGRTEPVRDTLRLTVWGPVPHLISGTPNADLAMHWLPSGDLDAHMSLVFPRINRARNLEEWKAPLLRYDAPMQNGLFASKTGDIALRISGKMPLRPPGDGRLIRDGSLSDQAWLGFVAPEDNPFAHNPAQGYLASANQQSTDRSYPWPYYGVFEDWRGRYLNERLRGREGLAVEDMMSLQNDNTSLLAREALQVLIPLIRDKVQDPTQREALRSLESWDHRFDARQTEPVLFDLWIKRTDTLAWDELYAARDSLPVEIPEKWRMIELLRDQPELHWWDIAATPERESAADLVYRTFQEAIQRLRELGAENRDHWAAYQATGIRHIARIEAFSASKLELGGHHSALNAMTSTNGPSWRMVVELGPEPRAFGIYPGGQSGNPGSPFYRQFLPVWQKGEYRTLTLIGDLKEATLTSPTVFQSHKN
jgi:penicillin G amidase